MLIISSGTTWPQRRGRRSWRVTAVLAGGPEVPLVGRGPSPLPSFLQEQLWCETIVHRCNWKKNNCCICANLSRCPMCSVSGGGWTPNTPAITVITFGGWSHGSTLARVSTVAAPASAQKPRGARCVRACVRARSRHHAAKYW